MKLNAWQEGCTEKAEDGYCSWRGMTSECERNATSNVEERKSGEETMR